MSTNSDKNTNTKVNGQHFIAGSWQATNSPSWASFDPAADQSLPWLFSEAEQSEVDVAAESAWQAFLAYRQTSPIQRAAFLEAIATEIEALGDSLIDVVMAESGLPQARVQGERGRTTNQLRAFAANLLHPLRPVFVDKANLDRTPLPKADHRLGHIALGPVTVFGASNFPLAFSAAGGDTASALAAGCPVIVKGHPAHPATTELVSRAIQSAAEKTAMPTGVFSMLQGQSHALSNRLVTHPRIQAVGFTGSFRVGMLLANLAAQRPQPIPFYGELGSTNPQVILPKKLALDGKSLAAQQVGSMMMGQGQFCTSPGLVLVCEGEGLEAYLSELAEQISAQQSGSMLTPGITETYKAQVSGYRDVLSLIAEGQADGHKTSAAMFRVDADDLTEELMSECFGPCALVVVCKNLSHLDMVISRLHGQLTASIHADEQEIADNMSVVASLELKVGRLIFNQMPTGVEVCNAMFHGGPFPASNDGRFTSVGSEAIWRFVRPICYQNMPHALLPEYLRNEAGNQVVK